jgi:predicted amidophosphoribosyltransferase
MVWSDDDLLDGVNYLFDYQKWYLSNGDKNPKIDAVTHHILNLKHNPGAEKHDPHRHAKAVTFFSRRLTVALGRLSEKQTPKLAVMIPSSTAHNISEGLASIVLNACHPRSIPHNCSCLTRVKSVSKKATGGSRSVEQHFHSIIIEGNAFERGSRILLIDDVTTTGNSMRACKQLLQDAGAGDVIMLALTQTAPEDE